MTTTITTSATEYLEHKILNYVLRDGLPPADLSGSYCWVALYSSDPTDLDTGTELSGSGYARVGPIGISSTARWSIANNTAIYPYQIDFTPSSASWGWVTHVGLKNDPTSGSLLFYGPLTPPVTSGIITSGSVWNNEGERFSIVGNSLSVVLSGAYSNYLASRVLQNVLSKTATTKLGLSIWASLYTTLPDANNYGGVEVTSTNRASVGGASNWTNPVSGSTTNNFQAWYMPATTDWGNVTGICFLTTPYSTIAGYLLLRTSLDTPVLILQGDRCVIAPGNIVVRVD